MKIFVVLNFCNIVQMLELDIQDKDAMNCIYWGIDINM